MEASLVSITSPQTARTQHTRIVQEIMSLMSFMFIYGIRLGTEDHVLVELVKYRKTGALKRARRESSIQNSGQWLLGVLARKQVKKDTKSQ